MKTKPPESALITFIEKKYPEYYGKICELREAIEGWLAYIPHSFPHYTRHTITHSDTIVSQISKLLFHDNNPEPTVKLSGVEAYILVAAAYLHDAGMVTPDREKAAILESEEWKRWTTDGGAAERWSEILKFRQQPDSAGLDAAKRNFLADIQTRFLIAEFIRARHHLRAADVIEVHHDELGRIDFGDHMLREAIAQVCVGHGLRQHELEDNERFPDRWDIREETVNLRFLAILLRLGDLLDMSVDRACPLLLNAASPLPPDSLAHWSQYQAIKRRETSPQKIGVLAECSNQEEHRVLQDWCQWIVDEIHNAKIVIPKCGRHHDWEVPEAVMESESPTIKIRPAKGANYIPSKWNLKFDQYSVFELLSKDLYQDPMVFVRELIQNGLDAMRCKMYADLETDGQETPEYPTQVPESFRNRYSLKISISEREVQNQLSEKKETKQVIVIEDNGIGMDEEIIEKYFLQVGRSFYQSEEFRRSFRFVPTSRFGIGFLSVFAASDFVTVETYKPTSQIANNAPVRITLTGLKNYLLREKSDKKNAGTRIEIVLRENIEQGKLTQLVLHWCKRVEFSIHVSDFGTEKIIIREKPEDFDYEESLITNPNAKFILRNFPIFENGIEGEIYILAYLDEVGESWVNLNWARNSYPKSHALARPAFIPKVLESFHGLTISETSSITGKSLIWRLDFRNRKFNPNLSRNGHIIDHWKLPREINDRIEEILTDHIRTSKITNSQNRFSYLNKLSESFWLDNFWKKFPNLVEIYLNGQRKRVSISELATHKEFTIFSNIEGTAESENEINELLLKESNEIPIVARSVINSLSNYLTDLVFDTHPILTDLRSISEKSILLKYSKDDETSREISKNKIQRIGYASISTSRIQSGYEYIGLELNDLNCFGFCCHNKHIYNQIVVLNLRNEFVEWLFRFKVASDNKSYELSKGLNNELLKLLGYIFENKTNFAKKAHKLEKFIGQITEIKELPKELHPPQIKITRKMFGWSK